jgi:maleylacetate reductase
MILSHAIRYNASAVPGAIDALARALGVDDPADAVAELVARLGLPSGLRECGVTEIDLDAVAQLSQSNGNVANNPAPVSEADARVILEAAY